MSNRPVSIAASLIAAAAIAIAPRAARADESVGSLALTPPRAGETTIEQEHYGYQILATDAVGWFSLGAGIPEGALVLWLVAPLIHAAQGNPGKTLGSYTLRATLPVVGAMLAMALHEDPSGEHTDFGEAVAGVVGFGLGVIVAQLIDCTVLATKEVRRGPARAWRVDVSRTQLGTTFGIAGGF